MDLLCELVEVSIGRLLDGCIVIITGVHIHFEQVKDHLSLLVVWHTDPEEHLLHTLHFIKLDCASDELKRALSLEVVAGVLGISAALGWPSTL